MLFPLYHPAAALYTPSMLKVLEEDFARIPALLDAGGARSRRRSKTTSPGRRARSRIGSARPVLTVRTELASASAGETEGIAARLAGRLALGDVVTVSGELGAGKTTFVRGACRELGVTRPVTSPTFTIGHRYAGVVPVVPPRPVPVRSGLSGRVGRPRAVLRGRDRLRRVARGGVGTLPPPRVARDARACRRRSPSRHARVRRERGATRHRVMLVLAFDTATDVATSALLQDGSRPRRASRLGAGAPRGRRRAPDGSRTARPSDLEAIVGRDRARELHEHANRARGRPRPRARARRSRRGRLDAGRARVVATRRVPGDRRAPRRGVRPGPRRGRARRPRARTGTLCVGDGAVRYREMLERQGCERPAR